MYLFVCLTILMPSPRQSISYFFLSGIGWLETFLDFFFLSVVSLFSRSVSFWVSFSSAAFFCFSNWNSKYFRLPLARWCSGSGKWETEIIVMITNSEDCSNVTKEYYTHRDGNNWASNMTWLYAIYSVWPYLVFRNKMYKQGKLIQGLIWRKMWDNKVTTKASSEQIHISRQWWEMYCSIHYNEYYSRAKSIHFRK